MIEENVPNELFFSFFFFHSPVARCPLARIAHCCWLLSIQLPFSAVWQVRRENGSGMRWRAWPHPNLTPPEAHLRTPLCQSPLCRLLAQEAQHRPPPARKLGAACVFLRFLFTTDNLSSRASIYLQILCQQCYSRCVFWCPQRAVCCGCKGAERLSCCEDYSAARDATGSAGCSAGSRFVGVVTFTNAQCFSRRICLQRVCYCVVVCTPLIHCIPLRLLPAADGVDAGVAPPNPEKSSVSAAAGSNKKQKRADKTTSPAIDSPLLVMVTDVVAKERIQTGLSPLPKADELKQMIIKTAATFGRILAEAELVKIQT